MEADEDDSLKEQHQPSSPSPSTVVDSGHEEVACEGGVGGGVEFVAVSETAEDVVRDGFVGGGGGDSDFVVERSGAVEAAGGVDGREGVDADVEGEGEKGGGGLGAAVWGVAGAVDGETGAGDADATVVEEGVDSEGGFDCRNEIGIKEEVLVEEEVDTEGGLDRGNEIEMKEDVGGSGESHEHIVGISDEAAEKAELMGSADIRGADAGCTAVASVAEGEVGIGTEGGCDNGSGIEIKEDIMESGDFPERVVGICDEETPKAELMESVYAEEANVVVADVADGEEDVDVGRNKEELIEDGGIDSKAVVEGQDDVVAADVDDSGVSKEEEVVAMVVEEDGAALVEEEEVVVEDNVGSHDVGMEKGVVDVNETEKASVSEFFPNVESMSGVVACAVEESEIADSKAEISLAENERVTSGDGESNGVVGMVDEIPMVGKDIGEMDVGINAGVDGAAETDERETADSIADGEEKEQDNAAVGVLGMLSDDATIEADETNGLANVDSTEGTDRKEVGDVGVEIDVEADDAVEDNVAEDKEMDDVLEETQDTERVDRPEETDATEDTDRVDRTEETDATEDTDMAEEEMEKVEQRKMNVLLNRKGGKSSKGGRASSKKKLEEDVCFICFDGGDLVLCDRRWASLSGLCYGCM